MHTSICIWNMFPIYTLYVNKSLKFGIYYYWSLLSCHVFHSHLSFISANVENQEDGQEGLGYDSKILLHFCKAEQHLLQTYLSVSSITSDAELKEGQGDIENLEEVSILSVTDKDILREGISLYP